jgi:hypothetical protein
MAAALHRGFNYLYKISFCQIKFHWSQASCPIGTTHLVSMWVVLFGQYVCCTSTTYVTSLKCFTSYHRSLAPFSMLTVPQPSLTVHHHCFLFTAPLPPSSLYHKHHTLTLLPSITNVTPSLDRHYPSTITTTPLSLSVHLNHHHHHHSITSPSPDQIFTCNTITTLSFHHPYISPTQSLIHQFTTTNTTTPFLYNEASTITASPRLNHQQYTITWLPHLNYQQFIITSSLHFQLITVASSLHQNHLLVFPSLHDSYVIISDGCYRTSLNVLRLLSSFCIAPERSSVVCDVHWLWRESY